MTVQPNPSSPRQKFREERKKRENIAYLSAFALLVVMAGLGVLGAQGILPFPFGTDFSDDVDFAEVGDVPCPAEGTLPSNPSTIRVQVLNTTSRQGLAKVATDMLTSAGYTPLEAGNSSPEYPGRVLIEAGPAAVGDAYTVARLFRGAKVTLTAGTDRTVTVQLGTFYDGATSPEEVTKVMKDMSPLAGPEQCLPLDPEQMPDVQLDEESGTQSADGAGQS